MAAPSDVKMAAENVETFSGMEAHYDDKREFYVHEMFDKVREVKELVTAARLQAQEADIRVKFATVYAERAISEAEAVHEVAATLAKTSRVIAALALEFANTTDASLVAAGEGEHVISFSFTDSDISKAAESSFEALEVSFPSPELMPSTQPMSQKGYPKTSTSFPGNTKNAYEKYNIIYPDELSPEETIVDKVTATDSLPIVWEDSYSAGWESNPVSWLEKKNNNKLKHKFSAHKREYYESPNSSLESDSFTDEDTNISTCQPTYVEHGTQTPARDDAQTQDGEVDRQIKLANIGEITLQLNAVMLENDGYYNDELDDTSEDQPANKDSDEEIDDDKENQPPTMKAENVNVADGEHGGEIE